MPPALEATRRGHRAGVIAPRGDADSGRGGGRLRAGRQERRFDLIIIDPPSFAHGRRRGQDFSVARDLTSLVAAALPVLRSGGTMMVSSNLRKMSLSGLRARVRAAAGDRRCRVIDTPPLPVDFAVDPDHAKTVFVEFS